MSVDLVALGFKLLVTPADSPDHVYKCERYIAARWLPSIPVQSGYSLRLVKNRGREQSTGILLHYIFYTAFTHWLTFSFINVKYSCILMTSHVATAGDCMFQKTWYFHRPRCQPSSKAEFGVLRDD